MERLQIFIILAITLILILLGIGWNKNIKKTKELESNYEILKKENNELMRLINVKDSIPEKENKLTEQLVSINKKLNKLNQTDEELKAIQSNIPELIFSDDTLSSIISDRIEDGVRFDELR